jgi:hypothetical protein
MLASTTLNAMLARRGQLEVVVKAEFTSARSGIPTDVTHAFP